MTRWSRHLLVGAVGTIGLWTLACTGAGEAPEEPQAAEPVEVEPAPARGRKGKGKGKAARGEASDPQRKIPATGTPDPLAGLSDADLCRSDTLLMLKYGFDELQGGKCGEVCCAVDQEHWCCGLDWPFSDVPTCDAYAGMRNGIFARYGYPFEDPKWREAFEGQPYYRRREDFDAKWLTATAAANVEVLKGRQDRKEGCMD